MNRRRGKLERVGLLSRSSASPCSFCLERNLGLDTDSTPDAIQLAVAKVFVFAAVSYAVYLCARNFLAHKHNAIVNRHRQNALLTYTTLRRGGP